MRKAVSLSVVLHAACLASLTYASLQSELPDAWIVWPGQSVPDAKPSYRPVWHLGDLLQGGSAADVSTLLGDPMVAVPQRVGANECWRYRFFGSDSLTLQFEGGVVRRSWFGSGLRLPSRCVGRLTRSVDAGRAANPPVVRSDLGCVLLM
jgi:hypothetical protein